MDGPTKSVQASDVRHLGLAAGPNGGDETLETAIRRIIYDPASGLVLVHPVNVGVEVCARLQVVFFPETCHLLDDLAPPWVASPPLHRGVEAVHDRVDL